MILDYKLGYLGRAIWISVHKLAVRAWVENVSNTFSFSPVDWFAAFRRIEQWDVVNVFSIGLGWFGHVLLTFTKYST